MSITTAASRTSTATGGGTRYERSSRCSFGGSIVDTACRAISSAALVRLLSASASSFEAAHCARRTSSSVRAASNVLSSEPKSLSSFRARGRLMSEDSLWTGALIRLGLMAPPAGGSPADENDVFAGPCDPQSSNEPVMVRSSVATSFPTDHCHRFLGGTTFPASGDEATSLSVAWSSCSINSIRTTSPAQKSEDTTYISNSVPRRITWRNDFFFDL